MHSGCMHSPGISENEFVAVARNEEAGIERPSTRPLVSVVMPMRNAELYVEKALQSVLIEHDVHLEVVVVDDGSSDRSRAIVDRIQDSRVRVISGPQRGFAASWNAGVQASRGEILMQCDADDFFAVGRICHQASWLLANEEFDAVCAAMAMMDATGHLVSEEGLNVGTGMPISISHELISGVVRTSLCTYALRRRVFDQVGIMREYFETAPDVDFQLRLAEQCTIAFFPYCCYLYRLHNSSITHTQAASRRQFFEAMAHTLQEERQRTGTDALSLGKALSPPRGTDAPTAVTDQVQGMLIGRSWTELVQGKRRQSAQTAIRAALIRPFKFHGWVSLAKVLIRASIRKGTYKVD